MLKAKDVYALPYAVPSERIDYVFNLHDLDGPIAGKWIRADVQQWPQGVSRVAIDVRVKDVMLFRQITEAEIQAIFDEATRLAATQAPWELSPSWSTATSWISSSTIGYSNWNSAPVRVTTSG